MTGMPKTRWIVAAAVAATFGIGIGAVDAARDHAGAAPAAKACLAPATWATLDGKAPQSVSATAVINEMAKKDVVLLGEFHNEADHHRWQLQVLAGLLAQRPNMIIGFEMFPRRVQPALDRWVAGSLTVKELLDQSEWARVWDFPAEFYLPLFEFARINRIPMVALNFDSKLNKAITANGWDAVPESEREGIGRPAPASKAYRDHLYEIYRAHDAVGGNKDPAKTPVTDPAFLRFVEAQTAWDRAMAEALAKSVANGPGPGRPLVVGIMGSGHVRDGYGVPHQLRALDVKNVGTLLPVSVDDDCKELRPGFADAVFALPLAAAVKPEPPRLGIRVEEADGGVRLVDVTPDGLADRTGLRKGDRLLQVAGVDAKKTSQVIAVIRQQPAGTWLPMRVQRGTETLDLVVKFPPKP